MPCNLAKARDPLEESGEEDGRDTRCQDDLRAAQTLTAHAVHQFPFVPTSWSTKCAQCPNAAKSSSFPMSDLRLPPSAFDSRSCREYSSFSLGAG